MKAKLSIFKTSLKQRRDVGKGLCLKTLLVLKAKCFAWTRVLPLKTLGTLGSHWNYPKLRPSAPCSHTDQMS